MTILKIEKYGFCGLREKSREVSKISKKISILIENMVDTMYANNGVGLAAPQVGHNLRIFVIDVTDPKDPVDPIIFINPKIVKKSGAVNSYEGCLSFPEMYTDCRRYSDIVVRATNFDGKPFVIEAKDGSLLSRAIQHEFDHLEGVLFVDHARSIMEASTLLNKYNLPNLDEAKLINEPEMEKEIASNPPTEEELARKAMRENK